LAGASISELDEHLNIIYVKVGLFYIEILITCGIVEKTVKLGTVEPHKVDREAIISIKLNPHKEQSPLLLLSSSFPMVCAHR
jgi:hypothetical protein